MIVKNKYIKINNGQKEITKNNHIKDELIFNILKGQIKNSSSSTPVRELWWNNRSKDLVRCFIKFDDEITYPNTRAPQDYDIYIEAKSKNTTGDSKSVNATFIYDSFDCYEIPTETKVDINNYAGHKITWIAFGCLYEDTYHKFDIPNDIKAYIRTTDYDIKIIENEKLIITRSDDYITEMECVGADYPLHLAYNSKKMPFEFLGNTYYLPPYARIYSIGYGTQKGIMTEERLVDDGEAIITLDRSYEDCIILEPFMSGDKLTQYPSAVSYPKNNKYPIKEYQIAEIYPTENLKPSNSKYPLKSNPKYAIIKYQIFGFYGKGGWNQFDFTNNFYTMNLPLDYIGTYKIKLNLERREDYGN